jgi:hypothetical protein
VSADVDKVKNALMSSRAFGTRSEALASLDRLATAEAQRDTLAEVVAAAQRYESLSAGFRAGDGTDWSGVDRAKRDYRAALAAVAPEAHQQVDGPLGHLEAS